MFLHLPQVINAAQLSGVQAKLSQTHAPWVDGRVTAGHQSAAGKRNQQMDQANPQTRELSDFLLAALERNALFISAVLPNRVFPPMFNRYGEGMHFAKHVDGSVRTLQSGLKLRTDLSATLFLSSPDAYDGGELIIENDLGRQNVKLDAGDMIIYGAAARHHVTPITRGERLAAVFWIQSLIRGDAERLQLFELDQTIQRLTELKTDSDCVLRLTSHYHSLLRLWSDT